jgi:hypothetical protein
MLAKLALPAGGLAAMTAVHCGLGVVVIALLAINRVRLRLLLLLRLMSFIWSSPV